jgi:signal transduction histidine kinase
MLQKILGVTGIISIVILSLLFIFIFMRVRHDMEDDLKRVERFIVSTSANGVQSIRNEILFLLEHYNGEMMALSSKGWEEDLKSLSLSEKYQMEGFPSLVTESEFISIDEAEDSFFIKNNVKNGAEILTSFSRWPWNQKPYFIQIQHFKGYMVFPAYDLTQNGLLGFYVVSLDIRPAVESYLPDHLMEELLTGEKKRSNNKSLQYEIFIEDGADLLGTKNSVLIDLNRNFNLYSIKDYFYIRPDSFLPLATVESIIDDHTYLVITHRNSEPGKRTWKKVRLYGTLSFLYFFLVGVLLLFLYSIYRIKKEHLREQQFTSLISHELKTPLSVIQLAGESLSGGYISEKSDVAEYGAMVMEETGRLGRMIENILLISTLTWKDKEGHTLYVDELFRDLSKKNRTLVKSQHIHWEEENHLGQFGFQTHPALLTAALQNIIHNGIIYGAARSKDRTLIFRAEKKNKRKREGILFSIIDHGPGVNRSDSQKIFFHYYRGQDVSAEQLPGSGIGLALSRNIAEGMGGSLILSRSVKTGATFEFWIPVRKSNEENIND